MKRQTLPLTIFLLISSFLSAKETIYYKVSTAGTDKARLFQAFEAAKDFERKKQTKETESFEVFQNISKNEFLVYRTRMFHTVVASGMARVGGGGQVTGASYEAADKSKLYYLRTISPVKVADGETIENIRVAETENTHSYTTTLGAKKTVRILEQLKPKEIRELTREEFVRRLKRGEVWSIPSFLQGKCRRCKGSGRIKVFKGSEKCEECSGRGEYKKDFVISW